MSQVLLLNGPNLNLLGRREPQLYGHSSLAELERQLGARALALGISLHCFQSNCEGALIDRVQEAAADGTGLVIVNPAAYSHTSIALRDAFLATELPLIEVHVSNIHRRESFRHHTYFADIAIGSIVGLGVYGYTLALDAARDWFDRQSAQDC